MAPRAPSRDPDADRPSLADGTRGAPVPPLGAVRRLPTHVEDLRPAPVGSRAFYLAMAEIMNFGYRELMDARQLGLYAWENGFDVLRAGYIKAHNGLVLRSR